MEASTDEDKEGVAPDQDDDLKMDYAREELEELDRALSAVKIDTSALTMPVKLDGEYLKNCPHTYKTNTKKEKILIALAENFRRQYAHIYPDRKPLLLCPLNECGVEKFVSTTLRPTVLSYPVFFSWEGCANFVADFLSLEPLDPPTDPPLHLYSPTHVLKTRRGSCFDFSNLLCSLLLAAGYNAYCVSGYATKDLCLLNLNRQDCPLLAKSQKDEVEQEAPAVLKYSVKPPRDLSSAFERRQEEMRQKEAQAARLKKQQEADRLQEELEKPPPDPLYGLRVHCWVLVKCGAREVPEDFFIEPLSGKTFTTSNQNFLGIESAWNHLNYWINMQDCRHGCKDMVFDLGDPVKWEYMLCGDTSQSLLLMQSTKKQEFEDEEEEKEDTKVFQMPQSWVKELQISQQDMEMRFPGGVKVIPYRKAKLEKFAPYLLKDGLVTRLTTYHDLDCTEVNIVKEWYQNRNDHLEERELRKAGNVTLEHFRRGRSFSLKHHRYVTLTPDSDREMEFYSQARADGLARRVEKDSEMTEYFDDRPDFLYYRHIVFGKRKRVAIVEQVVDQGHRPLVKVVERFHRDSSKAASEDIAERIFLVSEHRIQVTYHRDADRIIPAWRNFTKPNDSGDTQQKQVFKPEMASTFQVDPFQKPSKNLFLYKTLVDQMKAEEKVAQRIKDSEKEVRAILDIRGHEEKNVELHISIYNTARNDKARKHREALERLAEEARLLQEEKELDYLAPFLAQLGDPEKLTRSMAQRLRMECLADIKQRLIDKANLIQSRFEKETQELQQKQQWYQKNQANMNKEDEDQYLAYCSDAMFRIHVLKLRLNRHKDRATQKYLALDEKLRRDHRLAPLL
ncbi:dynein regulatory complex subunit 7 [Engraulis encrasicolus]|uniref:dynein regulatory complex subunit 7 n=1 Tax=Engraulis encrasicolus TaxID=184585 RepID=UPI002FD31480